MGDVMRFWCEEASNIRCVRESDFDAALAREAALREELAGTQAGAELRALLAAPVVERQDVSALMKIAADLANRNPLRQLYLVCEHQSRINTNSLHEHLDKCGDLLAGIALDIRRAITESVPPLIQTLHANGDRIEQHGLAGYVYVRAGEVDYDAETCVSNVPGDTIGDGDSWEPVFFGSDFGYFEKVAELRQQALDRAQATIAQMAQRIADLEQALAEEKAMYEAASDRSSILADAFHEQAQRIADLERGSGEPLAWSYCPECGCEELHHEEGEHKQCANCHQEWFSDIDYSEVVRGNLARLKADQTAPVAVVLPSECENKLVSTHYRNGWNACLDKIEEMNQ